jgi:DNA-directed RNA polymerase subunit RPC12/RpoP
MVDLKEWDGTEAEALDDQSDYGASDDFRAEEIQDAMRRYDAAKSAKTGSEIRCPQCGKRITKTTYNKVFCSNGRTVKGRSSCKDVYWNTVNPRGLALQDDEP